MNSLELPTYFNPLHNLYAKINLCLFHPNKFWTNSIEFSMDISSL